MIASAAAAAGLAEVWLRPSAPFLITPLLVSAVALVFAFRVHVRGRASQRHHEQQLQQSAALRLATVQALALAIDARDRSSQSQLRREQRHAGALARAFGMSEDDVEGVRTAALLHDIGKPKTREFGPEGVQFHHHEVVGARMAVDRLRALRYPTATIEEVSTLVEMHLRFHTYQGWADGAVRRYVRDAGDLLDDLNQLTRADCTTRNANKAKQFAAMQDELEERIAALAEQESLDAMRPPLDGVEVMEHLGLDPGPVVGDALEFLMELRLERGVIEKEEAFKLLDEWADARSSQEGR